MSALQPWLELVDSDDEGKHSHRRHCENRRPSRGGRSHSRSRSRSRDAKKEDPHKQRGRTKEDNSRDKTSRKYKAVAEEDMADVKEEKESEDDDDDDVKDDNKPRRNAYVEFARAYMKAQEAMGNAVTFKQALMECKKQWTGKNSGVKRRK
jgi:hypothetical protein